MENFQLTSIITLMSILITVLFAIRVGGARGKYEVKAPKCEGPEEFNRIYRVHQNTLEMMMLFLPSLWIFAASVSDQLAAAFGAIWLIGRIIYASSYVADPAKRSLGFTISFLAVAVMVIWSLVMIIIGMM